MNDAGRERFDELKEAYALGALSEEERGEFEDYLGLNPERQAEVDELMAITGLLALSPDELEPSPELRSRLMQTVLAEASDPEPERRSFFDSLRDYFGYRMLAAGAAVVAVVALLFWNVTLQTEIQDLQSEPDIARSQPETAEPRVLELQAADAAGTASGELIVLENQRGVLVTKDIPSLQENQVCQIWVIKGETPKSSGLFEPDEEDPVAAALTRSPLKGAVVAITVEPAGGSPAPTSDPILTTQL